MRVQGHFIFRRGRHIALGVDGVAVTDVGIGLCLDVCHIHCRTAGSAAACGCAAYSTGHLERMIRLDRNISAITARRLIRLVDLYAGIGIRLRAGGQVHHIDRPCQSGIRTACHLYSDIINIFRVLCRDSDLSFGVQFRLLIGIGGGILLEIRHTDSDAGAAAGDADRCPAVAAMQFGGVSGGDGNAIACFVCREGRSLAGVRFRFRIDDIYGCIAGHADRSADAPCDGRIGEIGRMVCGDLHLISAGNHSAVIRIGFRYGMEGYGRIGNADADGSAAADAACGCALCESGIGENLRALFDVNVRIADMCIGFLVHEGFRCRSGKTCRTAHAETGCTGHAAAGVFCFHGEASACHFCIITHDRTGFFVHHFDRCGETDTGISAGSTTACDGVQFRFILGGDRDITGLRHFTLAHIRFRIGRDGVRTGCPCPCESTGSAGKGRCDRGQVFFRVRIHGDGGRIFQGRTVGDACIGVTVVGLDIDSCAEAAPCGEGHAAGETEELRGACRSYLSRLLPRIVLALADGCISLLVDDIHGDRAGAGELRGAAGEADSDGLGGLGGLVAFGSVTVVGIVCFDGDAVCGDGLFLRFIAGQAGSDCRLVHHDADGCAGRVSADRCTAHADGRIAAILGKDGERAGIHFIFIGNMSVCIGMDIVTAGRERTGEFTGSCPGCHDGLDLAGLIRGDGESAAAVHCGIFERRGGFPFDEVRRDGRAHRRAVSAAGYRYGTGIGINRALVFGRDGRRLARLQAAAPDVRIGGVVHPVQADLACDGTAFGRAAAARCDVCDLRRIVCFDGQRGIVFFTACEAEGRIFGIGFIFVRDGIVHEAAGDRLAVLRKPEGNRTRTRRDLAVIARTDRERIRTDSAALGVGFGGIGDAVHGNIRCRGKAAFGSADILTHGGIFPCDVVQCGVAFLDLFLIFVRLACVQQFFCQFADRRGALAVRTFLCFQTGTACAVRLGAIHGDTAGCGHGVDRAGVLGGDGDVFRRSDRPLERCFCLAVDVVVCDGGADACLSGDSDRTADVDGLAIVLSADADVTVCVDGRFADRGFGGVFETVDIDCPVNGYGLPFAAGTCDGKIRAFVFCCDADILRLRDSHIVCHGRFGGILLMHGKRRAAQCGFPAAGERTSSDVFPEIEAPRLVADRRFDVAAEIHSVNIILRADGEVAIVDFYFRILLHRRFRGVVVLHDIQCRRAGDFLSRAARLCPGVRQIRQLEAIVRIKNGLKVICKILAEAFEIRLPGALRFRADIHIPFGLDIAR